MGAFTIYAMVVTGLYILYMGVTIAFDLHGKKDNKKEDVEEFNTTDAGEEKSTVIDETEEGFVVRNADDNTQGDLDNSNSSDSASAHHQQMQQGDDDDVAQEEQPVEDNPADEDLLNQESEASVHQFEELKDTVQEKMIMARPKYQQEYNSKEFQIASSQPMDKPMQMFRYMKANNRK